MDFTQISVTEVSRHFGRRRALARVSMICRTGEIVGLLGPNGAGKSTLLTILATLLQPSAGEVRYGALAAGEAGPALRARIGLLAHDLFLYPELTARENLTFFARLYGGGAPARVDEALARANLDERADDVVAGFSRGMRQRLGLERALIHGPRLVLLDEPFTGLDDASCAALVVRLRSLRAAGAIVLLATHDLDLVDGLLDRVALFREGRLVSLEACPSGLRASYRSGIGSAVS